MTMTSMIPVMFVIMAVMVVFVMMAGIVVSMDYYVPFVYITKWVKSSLIDNYTMFIENLYLKDILSMPLHRNPGINS